MAFLFYSPRNQENPSGTYGAHDFGEGESLNTLLILWCQRDCQILPVPIHTSCIFYLTFFFFPDLKLPVWSFDKLDSIMCLPKLSSTSKKKITKKWQQSMILWLTKDQFVCNSAQWFGQLIKLLCQSKTLRTLTFCSAKSRRVLDSLFDSPPLEIERTALQTEFLSEGW